MMLAGIEPIVKMKAGRHRMSRHPNPARERFPRSWATLRIGTAAFPSIAARMGRSSNAPPKPAAPETVAAIQPQNSSTIHLTIIPSRIEV